VCICLPLALVSIRAEFSNPLHFNMQKSIHQGDLSCNPKNRAPAELSAVQKLLFPMQSKRGLKSLIDE
jgi:hypothetical protein